MPGRDGVAALRLRADDGLVDAARAALEDLAVLVDEEVVADVVPAVGVAVVARDAEHDRGRVLRAVVVGGDRVVDEGELDLAVVGGRARGHGVAAPLGARDDHGRPAWAARAPPVARRRRRPRRRAPARRATAAVGRVRTKRARRPRASPRRRSWKRSAGPVHAGSVPAGAPRRRRAGGRRARCSAHPGAPVAAAPAGAHLGLDAPRRAPSAGRPGRSGAARAAPRSCASRRRPPRGRPRPPGRARTARSGWPGRGRSAARPRASAAAPSPSASLTGEATSEHTDGTRHGAEWTVFGRSGASPATAPSVVRAVGAGPAEHDVVRAQVVARGARRRRASSRSSSGSSNGVELAAAVADRVVVVLAARIGGLEARGAVHVERGGRASSAARTSSAR